MSRLSPSPRLDCYPSHVSLRKVLLIYTVLTSALQAPLLLCVLAIALAPPAASQPVSPLFFCPLASAALQQALQTTNMCSKTAQLKCQLIRTAMKPSRT